VLPATMMVMMTTMTPMTRPSAPASSILDGDVLFADFLAGLVEKGLAGEPLPAVPKVSS
jgi:hypothetical protein